MSRLYGRSSLATSATDSSLAGTVHLGSKISQGKQRVNGKLSSNTSDSDSSEEETDLSRLKRKHATNNASQARNTGEDGSETETETRNDNVAANPPAGEPAEELLRKKPKVTRRVFTEEMLVSNLGIDLIYQTFPRTCRLRGRGYEAADLKNLITHYTGWAYQLYPDLAFPDMLHRIHSLGTKSSLRARLSHLRETERNRYLVSKRCVCAFPPY
jgi:hypothetical protein